MYDLFVIDPPWNQTKGGKRSVRPNQGRVLDYSTMTVPEIFSLLDKEIFSMATPQHIVFLWNIEKFLHKGDEYMKKRGYRRHIRFVWDKTNGIAPAFSVRFSHEYLVWYYKPKFTPVAEESRGKFRSVFREAAREHSRKPDFPYSVLIPSLFPESQKIDVFSREKRDGWDQWGNETDYF